MQCEKQNNSYVGLLLGWISYTVLGPKVIMLGEVDQLEFFFSKTVNYDSLDPKWHKKSDFELLAEVIKIVMVMPNLGLSHS